MHKIKKTFHLAYGHRLLAYKGKCSNLHGHNAVVEITLKSAKLDQQQMVMDFTELGEKLKAWLDEHLDHKLILAEADPLAPVLKAQGQACFLTAASPTAEALAQLIFRAARALKLPVHEVAFWETPTAAASYKE